MLNQLTLTLDSKQTTAFTSLLLGVFINNNSIRSMSGLTNVTEKAVLQRYGQPFIDALDAFSNYSTLEQVFVVKTLQRYIF